MINSPVNFTTFEPPANSTTRFFDLLNILDILNLLFGLPTHSYVIRLIVTGTENEIASGFFNLNLSVCELGNCLNSLLTLLNTWITISTIIKIMSGFLIGLSITGRPLFQCLICVERYLAVVHPVTFLKYKPLRYRAICCAVVWIITLGSCLICIYTKDKFHIHVWFFSLQFLFFISIQLFCLVAVLRALKQSGPEERKKEENHMKRRAFDVILISTVSMSIIYVPYTISGLFYILTHRYFEECFTVGFICYILAGFVQPVLYLNRVGKLSCSCLHLNI